MRSSTSTAASSESGIAAQAIVAERRLNRNRNTTAITISPPSSSDSRTLPVAVAMKLAGRNRSRCSTMPSLRQHRRELGERGLRPRASPRPCCCRTARRDSTIRRRAAVDRRAADRRLGRHRRRRPRSRARCWRRRALTSTVRPISAALGDWPSAAQHDPLVGGVDEARAAHAGGAPGRGQHVVDAEPVADQPLGVDLDLDRALSPPKIATSATPGTREQARPHRHCAASRSAIGERAAEVRPITSTVLVDEVSGVRPGGAAPRQRPPPRSPAARPRPAGRGRCRSRGRSTRSAPTGPGSRSSAGCARRARR